MWSVGFKVLKMMTGKISVLLGVMCRLVDMCHSDGGTSHLHLQGTLNWRQEYIVEYKCILNVVFGIWKVCHHLALLVVNCRKYILSYLEPEFNDKLFISCQTLSYVS
jgi:hypothetical protein